MNTKQMDYIIEIAQTLNFNRAAENLFISQPALSYQVKILEEEIGFPIFDSTGKTIRLTPAGQQFCQQLGPLRSQLQLIIEQGQNFSSQYSDNISLGFSLRSQLQFLPEIIRNFKTSHPQVLITPEIRPTDWLAPFRDGQVDLIFTSREMAEKLSNAMIHSLYQSHIYLLVNPNDPLAKLKLAKAKDLKGRTLLVNGGSSQTLREVQRKVLEEYPLATLNSPNHDFTMISVASEQAICLSPGYLNDFTNQFTWVPFETDASFDCVLVSHLDDQRESLKEFITCMKTIYAEKSLYYRL